MERSETPFIFAIRCDFIFNSRLFLSVPLPSALRRTQFSIKLSTTKALLSILGGKGDEHGTDHPTSLPTTGRALPPHPPSARAHRIADRFTLPLHIQIDLIKEYYKPRARPFMQEQL